MKYIETGLKPQPNEIEVKEAAAQGIPSIEIDPAKIPNELREQIQSQGMRVTREQLMQLQNLQGMPHNPLPNGLPPSEKYYGEVAKGYDEKRQKSIKWTKEQSIVERMLSDMPENTKVLDAPCGTGRFFPFYHFKKFVVRGIDISPDMLLEATKKIEDPTGEHDGEPRWAWLERNLIEHGSGMENDSVDVAVSVRFTRWVMGQYGEQGIRTLLTELQRVARKKVIFTARIKNHQHAVPLELIEDCLVDGWSIYENAEGYEEAYRVIQLGPEA